MSVVDIGLLYTVFRKKQPLLFSYITLRKNNHFLKKCFVTEDGVLMGKTFHGKSDSSGITDSC